MHRLAPLLRRSFFLQWLLANALGWSAGLYLGSLSLRLLGGVSGLLIGGAVAGGIVGIAQGIVLRGWLDLSVRRWLGYSLVAGVVGVLPVVVLSFSLVIGSVGLALLGGVFGAIFGSIQWLVLTDHLEGAAFWILANVIGGALCAVFSLAGFPIVLPIFLTAGPYLFGGITGLALRWLRQLPVDE